MRRLTSKSYRASPLLGDLWRCSCRQACQRSTHREPAVGRNAAHDPSRETRPCRCALDASVENIEIGCLGVRNNQFAARSRGFVLRRCDFLWQSRLTRLADSFEERCYERRIVGVLLDQVIRLGIVGIMIRLHKRTRSFIENDGLSWTGKVRTTTTLSSPPAAFYPFPNPELCGRR